MQTRQVLSCRCAPASNINVYNYKTNINTHNLYVYESFEFTNCYNDPCLGWTGTAMAPLDR